MESFLFGLFGFGLGCGLGIYLERKRASRIIYVCTYHLDSEIGRIDQAPKRKLPQ